MVFDVFFWVEEGNEKERENHNHGGNNDSSDHEIFGNHKNFLFS